MSSTDQVDLVLVGELSDDVLAKREADAAVVIAPIRDFFVRIRPKQVAKQSSIRHIRWPHDIVDGLDFVQLR